jgi:uroporphyrinogen-III synthase
VAIAGACADALAGHEALRRGRLLVLADDGGRPQLTAELQALGASVEVVPVYRHLVRWAPLRDLAFDLVIAPSSSAALHLGEGPHAAGLRARPWLAMGPLSAAAARKVGAGDVHVAEHDDPDSVIARAREILS